MCNNQSLPPAGYAEKVMQNLARVNDPNADLASDADIETAAQYNLPIDNDFLAHEIQEVGEIGYGINVLQDSGALIDRGVKRLMEYAYDEIFKAFMPRRADRPSLQPAATAPYQEFIAQWLDNIHSRRCDKELGLEDLIYELGGLGFVPQASMCFTSMIQSYLPTKLDFSSWVGEMVKQKLVGDSGAASNAGELIFWQHWMGRGYATLMEREWARLDQCLAFTGKGGHGRLVWREDTFGVHKHMRPDIELMIQTAERSLVSLSVQIANWLAWCIVKDHAEPMAMPDVSHVRREIRAVPAARAKGARSLARNRPCLLLAPREQQQHPFRARAPL
ncbi:hypothetical protein MBLNU13_g03642t1 [Cladosporium sp. NU13]